MSKSMTWKERLSSFRTEVLMGAVAVITLLAIWLVPAQKETAPPALPELTSTPPAETESRSQPPSGETGAVTRDGDRARAIIAGMRAAGGKPDPAEVFARAEELNGEGHQEDAYLLYRFAANHGHARAALVLASQADPAYYSPTDSLLPQAEPEQAIKWYRVASAAGNEEAAARLQALHRRLQDAAAAGDAQAQRLLLQWQ
jgi:hypothetical protein